MSLEISARKIEIAEGYLLEFVVLDQWCISARLLTEKDHTLSSPESLRIARDNFHRNGEIDEESGNEVESAKEAIPAFVQRVAKEAVDWAHSEIKEHEEALRVVSALQVALKKKYGLSK